MRMHLSFDTWTARLLTALSLPAIAACGSSTDPGPSDFPCESPQPIGESGYVTCSNGFTHRASVVTCTSTVPRAEEICPGVTPGPGSCASDADCAEMPNGFCGFEGQLSCVCVSGCTTDAECGSGQICECGDPMGRCITATCTSDADCDGGFCASTIEGDPGCGSAIFACTTPADECGGYSDCEDGQGCTLVDGVRECVEYSCAIGRPFLIAGAERVAPLAWRDDWLAEAPAPCLDGLGEAEQAALAEHWARAGLMEHASVAAFARFALQLLALGAPADLVRDTQAAMGDEIEHARLCFAMSRAYGGRAVGPGRLAIEGALEHRDLAAIVGDVILEGCIGETVAAIEAAEASSRATDPLVAKTLARIAEDETRHAELAWRFVRWALAGDATLHGEVARIFRPAIEAGTGEEVTKDDEAWLALGRVTGPMHRSLRAAALRGVIAPCARALLGGGRSAALAGVVDRADV